MWRKTDDIAARRLTHAVNVTLTLCVRCIASVDACVMRPRKIVVQMAQSRRKDISWRKSFHSDSKPVSFH